MTTVRCYDICECGHYCHEHAPLIADEPYYFCTVEDCDCDDFEEEE